MKNIIIVSDDICAIKQIVNTINKMHFSPTITIYSTSDFKTKVKNKKTPKNDIIYLIDTYNMEADFIDILSRLREYDFASTIIVIGMYEYQYAVISSRLMILDYLLKWNNFTERLKETLSHLLVNKPTKIEENTLKITDKNIPIVLKKNDIESIYHLPNNQISIHYKNGNNSILVSLKNATPQIKELTQNSFYTDKSSLKSPKRTYYSDPFKQLLVDLYLIFKIDSNTLSKHFHIDEKNIKKWASLTKYCRKINILEFIIGKLIIKSYFKK